MEALKNNTVGYAIAAIGAVVALAGGLADTLGIGAEGADGLGGKQLAALLVGLVILAAGLAVVFLSGQDEESGDAGESSAAADAAPAEDSSAADSSDADSGDADGEAESSDAGEPATADAQAADAD
ncbi:MAG TPA: hypothetical protein VIL36_02125 [Acidimicrobiales bacterium]